MYKCVCTDTVTSLYRGRFYARCAKNTSLYREYRYTGDIVISEWGARLRKINSVFKRTRHYTISTFVFLMRCKWDARWFSAIPHLRVISRIVVSGFHCTKRSRGVDYIASRDTKMQYHNKYPRFCRKLQKGKKQQQSINVAFVAKDLALENPGIDPGTSRMQSGRSTIWANPPTHNTVNDVTNARGVY